MLAISRLFLCIVTVHQFSNVESLTGWVKPAKENEFPFVVSIGRKSDVSPNNPHGHICGGALITETFVLTSANCFSAHKTSSDYLVYAGSNYLDLSDKLEIESWITYDCWSRTGKLCNDSRYSDSDIAIVKLKERVRSPARATLISTLPPDQLAGQIITTAGWSATHITSTPRQMLKADLRVIGSDECKVIVLVLLGDEIPPNEYEKNIFCTKGFTSFAALDQGDTGSPVFIDQGNGDYRIVGVNQMAVQSETDQSPDQKNNKHIGVLPYLEFIMSVTDFKL